MCWSPLKTQDEILKSLLPGDSDTSMVDCLEPEAEGCSRDREKQSHRERQKESSQKVRDIESGRREDGEFCALMSAA